MQGKIYIFLTIFLLIIIQASAFRTKYDFKLLYEWKQIEYKFASEKERSEAIKNGTFNAGGVQPLDAQFTYDANSKQKRMFITTPRLAPGVPATFGTITNETRNGNPVIEPYPSWSWHINPEKCNCRRIVSVFRVWVDECDRLWVADLGVVNSKFVCPPQILAFDFKTDKLLHKYEVPYDQYQNASWFSTPTVEIENLEDNCINTWVYVTDSVAQSLLVYSLKQKKSWRIMDKSFKFDPKYINYTIDGETFQIADGISTVAVTPNNSLNNLKLRYHAMSSIKESWIYTKYLKDPSNFKKPYGSPQLFHTYKGRRNQQAGTEVIDKYGYVYFPLLIDILLVKWDPKTEYKQENFHVIANDKKRMQFPTGLRIAPYNGTSSEGLWVFATSFQRFISGTLNGNKTNFRLFFTKLS